MALVVYKAGQSLGERSLGGVLRERWADIRSSVLRAIEARKLAGAPLVDEVSGAEIRDPGEYPGDPELDDVRITVFAMSVAQMHDIEADLRSAVDAGSTLADKVKARLDEDAASCRAIERIVGRVSGLEDESGAPLVLYPDKPADMQILVDNRLIDPIVTAACWLQSVRGERRKNCGALQPSKTSPTTTATLATHTVDVSEDATTMHHVHTGPV